MATWPWLYLSDEVDWRGTVQERLPEDSRRGRRLSRRARSLITRRLAEQDLWLSLISVWEVAKKVENGHLVLDRPVSQWLDEAVTQPGLGIWEMTRPVLIQSCELPQPFHGDPADQILVATARHHGATLVTRDSRIRRYTDVQSYW